MKKEKRYVHTLQKRQRDLDYLFEVCFKISVSCVSKVICFHSTFLEAISVHIKEHP